MRELLTRLREDDPLWNDKGLTDGELDEIGRRIKLAEREPSRARTRNVMAGVFSAALVCLVAGGLQVVRWWPDSTGPIQPPLDSVQAHRPPQQFQFSGPQGTRLIWTLNSSLEIK